MAETITEWQKRQFNSNVKFVYQQMESMVTKYIDSEMYHGNVQGNLDDFDVAGASLTRDRVDRYEETQWGELEKSRRWCRPIRAYLALPLDRYDKVRSAIEDINSIHTRAIVYALRRNEDKRAIDAMNGLALGGEQATVSTALPSSQQIALGSSPSDVLTLTKIKAVSANFDQNAVPIGKRHWLYSPGQKSAILAITQAASSDFTAHKIYDRGDIDSLDWMGFVWHHIFDVKNQGAAGLTTIQRMLNLSGTTRTNLAFASDAVGVSKCEDIKTELDYLPTKTYTWQAFGEIDVNAVRVLDGGVMSILCKEE